MTTIAKKAAVYLMLALALTGVLPAIAKAEEATTAPAIYTLDHTNIFFSTVALNSPAGDTMEYEKSVADRADRLNTYFSKREMPLAGLGENFVRAADACGLDWKLLPAIGVRESSGGKHYMNNNPFGWGSAKIKYADFSEAIADVTEHLCGVRETTSSYYKDKSIYQKLWYYNGSVMPSYPAEVIAIMNKF